MSKKFKNISKVKLPKSRTEKEEFGKAKRSIIQCRKCGAFYYQKSWHHSADSYIAKRKDVDIPFRFARCPACAMIGRGQYEGMVIVENVPKRFANEVLNLIRLFSERAYRRDPEDRLIRAETKGSSIRATFTENQLAVRTAEKISEVFNKVAIEIRHSQEPSDVAVVRLSFPLGRYGK